MRHNLSNYQTDGCESIGEQEKRLRKARLIFDPTRLEWYWWVGLFVCAATNLAAGVLVILLAAWRGQMVEDGDGNRF